MNAIATAWRGPTRSTPFLAGGLALALLAAALSNMMLGPAGVSPERVLSLLFSPDGSLDSHYVQSVRLPRALAGAAAGATLGVAGVLLQVAVRNALAEPGTMGINQGAMLAVTLGGVFGFTLGPLASVPLAFAGGLAAAALVLGLSRAGDPTRMILAGVAIAFACAAASSALMIFFHELQGGLFAWGQGSLDQTGWSSVRLLVPAVPVLVAAALLLSRDLDALALGDDAAEGLGVRAGRTRVIALVGAVLLAAVAVSLVGPIAFVGLAAPHLARRLGVIRHRAQMVVAALAGAVLLLGADLIAQAIGGEALAAGAVATLLGAPLLIAIARNMPIQASPMALRSAERVHKPRPLPPLAGMAICFVTFAVGLVATLGIGELALGPVDVIKGAFGYGQWALVVQELRLPRGLVSAFAGAALGICGVLLQGASRNPLAGPEILGVTGGATVGAVAVLFFVDASATLLAISAFGGGIAALALVTALAPANLDPPRVALIGVAVAAACTALVDVMIRQAGLEATKGLVFLAGTTYGLGWSHLSVLLPVVVVAGAASWLLARKLDALGAGDDLAIALGVAPVRTRLVVIMIAAVLAAASVAAVGAVGFVGLMAPHVARLLVGPGHRLVVPAAAACGATLLLIADLLSRSILPEARELPAGLVTAIIGAPVLLAVLRRT